MHRVLFYGPFMRETQESTLDEARSMADLLYAAEKYPDQTATYLYRRYVEAKEDEARGRDGGRRRLCHASLEFF